MSSVQHLRQFISERLNAAAEEIFSEFEKTIVQYEEEIDRQRKLVEISWKPRINVHTAEVPHQQVCKVDETVQDDQQLCDQELDTNLDQEQPESARIKEEEEELLTSQEEELLLKDETDNVSIAAAHEENDHNDPKSNEDHIPSYASSVDGHSHVEGSRVKDSVPARYAVRKQKTSRQTKTNKTEDSSLLGSHCNTRHTAKKRADRGKSFLSLSSLRKRKTIREKQYCCETCGETFKDKTKFSVHVRFHTNEKPYSCQMCGKCFSRNFDVLRHMKIHTGERPYSCKTCGKGFCRKYHLECHMRTHTGEKPYSCKTCGKCFRSTSDCLRHMRTHTDEKPHSCKTCGKCFHRNYHLVCHMRTHTGEKPYSCKTCGKRFSQNSGLLYHIRNNTDKKP